MKKIITILILFSVFILNGCITFNKVSYTVVMKTKTTGVGQINFTDIRSDAQTDEDFEKDKENLFEFMYKSDEFIEIMKDEGKEIFERELFLKEDTLNGEVKFYFDDITQVEGIAYEEGYYYLTMPLEDSVISTNGEIVPSDEYKRIIWGENTDTLKFEMYSISFEDGAYKKLAPFYNPE